MRLPVFTLTGVASLTTWQRSTPSAATSVPAMDGEETAAAGATSAVPPMPSNSGARCSAEEVELSLSPTIIDHMIFLLFHLLNHPFHSHSHPSSYFSFAHTLNFAHDLLLATGRKELLAKGLTYQQVLDSLSRDPEHYSG